MQNNYWQTWRQYLQRWELVPMARFLAGLIYPLLPFASQVMFLGLPLFKSAALGDEYMALLDLLGDKDMLRQFLEYAQESMA